jgi:hypothetical protein
VFKKSVPQMLVKKIPEKKNTPLKFSEQSKEFIDNLKRKFNHPSSYPQNLEPINSIQILP